MQRNDHDQTLYSPSDLVTFLGCHHATFLDLKALEGDMEPAEVRPTAQLLQRKGLEHEAAYLRHLKDTGRTVIEIPAERSFSERVGLTQDAIRSGAEVIYQAALIKVPWRGVADFLMRCDTPSDLGNFSYEALDTKLARSVAPRHILQLCVYCDLLAQQQGICPKTLYVVTGEGQEHAYRVADYLHYSLHAKAHFERYLQHLPSNSSPEPCHHCLYCRWQDRCEVQWQADDHLSLIANIRRSQINKLRKDGIETVTDLSETSPDTSIPNLNTEVFSRLRSQAILQHHKATTGQDRYELVPFPPGKGLTRLPDPEAGDLFFDMEGDPLYPNGLEYLFGVCHAENGTVVFHPFWAHNPDEEKATFKRFMAFVKQHLARHAHAHIYHYHHYETTALKRLACRHAVCEEFLDNLLRAHKFVDLYPVVRESLRTSEPGLSIKHLETFYMGRRTDIVSTTIDSLIAYNEWRITRADHLLQAIADYNQKDCLSTRKLRDWLMTLLPDEVCELKKPAACFEEDSRSRKPWEIEYEMTRDLLEIASRVPQPLRETVAHLLEFHNREAKPQWWNAFARQDKLEDELIDDVECIGGLQRIGKPKVIQDALVYTYQFPPQEHKLKVDDQPVVVATLESAGTIVSLDETAGIVKIQCGPNHEPLLERLSIGPPKPYRTQVIRSAIYRYANHILHSFDTPHVATELLMRHLPRLRDKPPGVVLRTTADLPDDILNGVAALDNSYLLIQGPPGSGKTHTCSHVIVELVRRGKKVGITSNSHKAIHNLLDRVEQVATNQDVSFLGIKKSTKGKEETVFAGHFIHSEFTTADIPLGANLFAGTAWAFSHQHFHRHLDYLFIDEAGQVSLANVVAMANATKNLILVGDQMQLGQPIQGTHPGEAGLSVLEFLLADQATIPPERGFFLDQTRRMRPRLCRFVSEAFYDSRLTSHRCTANRRLNLKAANLPNDGVVVIPADHEACSQKSVEEGQIIQSTFQTLLGQSYVDGDHDTRLITEEDILVIAPYNVQVNHLRSILPKPARVGTIDKFQGQEAPIVLISMVTSSAEDLPRHIEFLYSRNRLNVAISRAQCLAIVIMNPRLLEIPCQTVAQMKLINTFCWLDQSAQKISLGT